MGSFSNVSRGTVSWWNISNILTIKTQKMKFKKVASIVLIITSILTGLIVYSQVSPPKTTAKVPITDSTAVLSLRDITQFNDLLKKQASYEQYTKLTPEQTLTELWAWKQNQLAVAAKKQLSDSTTNKKK